MIDYWFASYREQCEYHDICIKIKRFSSDLREDFKEFTQNHIHRIVLELDGLKEQRQNMQSRGVKVVNSTPIEWLNV